MIDVINDVPRSLLERIAKPVLFRAGEDAHADACAELRALLATAQPACATCNGHGLVGGFVNAESGYESHLCPNCNAHPAADVGAPCVGYTPIEAAAVIARLKNAPDLQHH